MRIFPVVKAAKQGDYENIMHSKFCVIDLNVTMHGSYNWTSKAPYNRETYDIKNGRKTAEKFAEQFIQLKLEYKKNNCLSYPSLKYD